MIEKIRKMAKRKGYGKISLVAKNDKLIKFYESLGFNLINRRKRRMVSEI